MNKIQKILSTAGRFISKNSPTIMTILASGGVVTSIGFSIGATKKSMEEIENEKNYRFVQAKKEGKPVNSSRDIRLTKKECFNICWKYYIPTAVTGLASIACIIGSNSVNMRRNAALAGLYSVSEKALAEYQNKVVEVVGDRKAEEIRDAVAQDAIMSNPVSENNVIITGNGNTLCYDVMSGRYFMSDIEKLRQAQNNINRDVINDGFKSLNDFYAEIGLDDIYLGREIGWDTDYLLDLKFTSKLNEHSQPCLVIQYAKTPRRD